MNNNYDAKIVMLPAPEAHQNADRLQIFNIGGMSVITDKSYYEGDIAVYFCLESQLNPKLLSHLNLYSSSEKNSNTAVKGFFDGKGRVRAVKLRGVPSEGFLLKLKVFNDAVHEALGVGGVAADIGYTFSSLGGVEIVNKYEPPARGEAGEYGGNKRKVRSSVIVPGQFALHYDTMPSHKADWLEPGMPVIITEKLHGSNCAVGKPLTYNDLPWWKRALNRVGFNFTPSTASRMIYASRNVVKNDDPDKINRHFYDEDIWAEALEPWLNGQDRWHAGITLYGEIVGVSKSGKAVQSTGGKAYDYSKLLGDRTLGFIAFRMTFTSLDGKVTEMCRSELEYYCNALNIPTVPVVEYGIISDNVGAWLKEVRNKYAVGNCLYCSNEVLREGVVIAYEYDPTHRFTIGKEMVCKLKSAEFLGKETIELDEL